MINLLAIVAAKSVLLAALAVWLKVPRQALARAIGIGLPVGAAFGLAFFGLFFVLVHAIGYHAPVTWDFVAVNAVLSYGVTATTVALLPLDLSDLPAGRPLVRESVYFTSTIAVGIGLLALTGSEFLKAFCIGAVLMSAAEVAALVGGRAGPVARMLHGDFGPLGVLLIATAALGAFYEGLNLVFPVWDWATLSDFPTHSRVGLMMAVGYIVLIHPLFVVLRLVEASLPSRS